MARSIAFEDLATVVFVWVDDWYQTCGVRWFQGKGISSLYSVTVK